MEQLSSTQPRGLRISSRENCAESALSTAAIIVGNAGEAFLAAVIVVPDAGGRGSIGLMM